MTDPDPNKWEHIGKRSAAGWYCWNCHIRLRGSVTCPGCHLGVDDEKIDVRPACYFTWAMDPQTLWKRMVDLKGNSVYGNDSAVDVSTTDEFFAMVDKMCPGGLWDTTQVGRIFT